MDPRLLAFLERQRAAGFAGLAGSELRATLRVSTALLQEAVVESAAATPAVRDVTVRPRASNRLDVHLKLARPAFLPSLNLTLIIDQQPQLPDNPLLGLHITGGGGMMRLAGPAISSFGVLPAGIRVEGDRMLVDVRVLLESRGLGELLRYAEQLQVMTEEDVLVLLVQARAR